MIKILLLFGGNSYEHNISCKSAKNIIENIDNNKFDLTMVGIDKCNNWYIFDDNLCYLDNGNWLNGNIKKIDNVVKFIKGYDKVFSIIHGNDGENGNLEGLFQLCNVKYVGSDLVASAISYDKEFTKIICKNYELPQVEYEVLRKNDKIHTNIGYPLVVKPSKGGSSLGIHVCNNKKEFVKHVKEAFLYDNKVIIEKYVKAREFECAILDCGKRIISKVGEIVSINTIYDYEAKYVKDSKLLIPANISKNLERKIRNYSDMIFNILGLSDLARVDFLYDYNNDILYFNEVNTLPGFTAISMYPKLIENMGISYKNLITKLLMN